MPALPTEPARTDAAAIVVAAGQGVRAGGDVPKQFARWRGKPLVRHSVEALAAAGLRPIVVAAPAGREHLAHVALAGIGGVTIVTGAASRQGSVRAALEALADAAPGRVLVHDAARPGLTAAVIARLLRALDDAPAAIPVLPVVDSLFREGVGPVARDGLHRIQTPQAFRFAEILAAHRRWAGELSAGDDAEVARAGGIPVAAVAGDEALRKITFAADLAGDSPSPATAMPPRIGFGSDVHRLVAGSDLWLCGVRIEHSHGLAGHSDADVALHALTDAVLGAIAAGDIGDHFPPSDPRWRGASSDRFLAYAVALAARAGYAIGNADLTLVCEAPRIGIHREAMRARVAGILGVDIAAVSVKATTSERLGFTGRGEGIAAQAVALLLPADQGPARA